MLRTDDVVYESEQTIHSKVFQEEMTDEAMYIRMDNGMSTYWESCLQVFSSEKKYFYLRDFSYLRRCPQWGPKTTIKIIITYK